MDPLKTRTGLPRACVGACWLAYLMAGAFILAGIPLFMWVVVEIMVHSWIPTVIRHLIFRVSKKAP